MFKIEYPYAFLFLLLPIVIMRFKRQDLQKLRALKIPYYNSVKSIGFSITNKSSSIFANVILALIWGLLCFAISNPKWVDDPIEIPREGRDIVLAIDVSASMEIPDMMLNGKAVDRLTVVKKVAREFVDRRIGDRLGLVLFGSQAYLQTPLTFDRKTVKNMIDDTSIKLAGPMTAIGEAIGISIKRLRNVSGDSKVLVLLTDGANNTGVEPIKAAEMARDNNIKIYTIGLGADALRVQTLLGTQIVNPSQDLDEDSLKEIAKITGGKFFRALNTQDLDQVYQTIDQLEPNEKESAGSFRPEYELFHWPLTIAMVLSMLLLVRKLTGLSRWI